MVGGQTGNVPYDLYDLPDLTEILNLETWNNCLTENERFSLSAFLPDVDQETFWLTMKELLSGKVMFFSSPLEKFLTGLKGGLYHAEVTRLRESLLFFRKREYCHFVRSYHGNMIQKFMDMKKVWNNSQPGISVEERINIWNDQKCHKPVLLVDLNAYPEDDAINKSDKNIEMVPVSKKKRHLNDSHEPDVALSSMLWKSKTKAKGVLKVKPVETMNHIQNYVVQPFTTEKMEPSKRMPKGVLKIKPKYVPSDPSIPVNSQVNSQKNVTADLLSMHAPVISSTYSFQHGDHAEKLPYFHQIERDARVNRNQELVHVQRKEELPTRVTMSLQSSQNRETTPMFMKGTRLQDAAELGKSTFPLEVSSSLRNNPHEAGHIGKWCDGKALGKHSKAKLGGLTNASSKASMFESFHDRFMTFQEMQANKTASETSLRISSSSSNKHPISRDNSIDLNHRLGIQTDGLRTASGHIDDSSGNKLLLPITYKRKKPSGKPKHEEPPKEQPSVNNDEPANLTSPLSIKPKSIKIKFKGFTGYNV